MLLIVVVVAVNNRLLRVELTDKRWGFREIERPWGKTYIHAFNQYNMQINNKDIRNHNKDKLIEHLVRIKNKEVKRLYPDIFILILFLWFLI